MGFYPWIEVTPTRSGAIASPEVLSAAVKYAPWSRRMNAPTTPDVTKASMGSLTIICAEAGR
jgi:hypothetical protein